MIRIVLFVRSVDIDILKVGNNALKAKKFQDSRDCIRDFLRAVRSVGGEYTGVRVEQVIRVFICEHEIELVELNGRYAITRIQAA